MKKQSRNSLVVLFVVINLICCVYNTKNNLLIFRNDYNLAKQTALAQNRKLLISFEAISLPTSYFYNFLQDSRFTKAILKDYVVLRLLCDDHRIIEGDSISIGRRNLNLEIKLTGQNSQPLFYIEDGKESKYVGYVNIEEMLLFIENN